MEIKGSVAVVTGGASGLGEATVRNFVASGGKVGILDLQEEKGRHLSDELGADAIFCLTDGAFSKASGTSGRIRHAGSPNC